ncbi:hypothetical protein SUDANB108_00049 [Streptomyces sp. enrichment culture]|uniref:hypothetical protein n=1 Tax=Streptomyces sp. enrichment culture TaxID=1795815 RepID=UPI003F566583
MLSQDTLPTTETAPGTPLDVTGRICVTAPYFALRDLRQTAPGEVTATVPVESSRGRQAAVMGIGEVGRHLAILGLCAASSVNPRAGRHAYLARTAEVQWVAAPTLAPPVGPLTGRAHARTTTDRRATAQTLLVDSGSGQVLAQMRIGYDVVPHRLLTRLLEGENTPAAATHTSADSASPYARPLPLRDLAYDERNGEARGSLLITPDLCPGHFDGHPVLPVAVAATAMSNLVDHAITQRHPHAHWLAGPLTLSADRFACAGQTVTFKARPAGTMSYHCTAELDDQPIASVTVQLILVDALLLPGPEAGVGTPQQRER